MVRPLRPLSASLSSALRSLSALRTSALTAALLGASALRTALAASA